MTVIVTAEVLGQTRDKYEGMLAALAPALRCAPGFILHAAWCGDGEWRVMEVWASQAQADAFFVKHVAPNLPPGVRPKRRLHEAVGLVAGGIEV